MSESKKFAFDVGITFIASIISMLFGIVISVLLGRYLGANYLGLYRMVSSIQTIAILFASVGISAAVIKYVAEFKGDQIKINSIVSAGIINSLLLGIGASIVVYLSSGIFEEIFKMPGLSGLLKILSLVFPFVLVGEVLLGFLNGMREMKKYGKATIIQSVLMVVFSVPLIYFGFGVAGVVTGIVMSSMGWCLYLLLISKNYFEITFDEYASNTKKMLVFGAQIFIGNAINMVNYQADTIMIGYFLTAADLGYYAVALGLTKFFWMIPGAIQAITYPATSEYWGKNNHSALNVMIDKSMRYTAFALFPIGLGIVFFAKEIITLIYGYDFIHSVFSAQVLVVGTVIFGVMKSIGGTITGVGRPDLSAKIVVISASINILLNFLLIPKFGIDGAAVATCISLTTSSILTILLTVKTLKLNIDLRWAAKISGVTLLAVLLFQYFKQINVYAVGLLIMSIYIFLILRTLFDNEDYKHLIKLLKSWVHAI